MFTLASLETANFVAKWKRSDGQSSGRAFFYIRGWQDAVEQLPGALQSGLGRQPSARGKVFGLVDQFARGVPKARLVTPQGEAMDPPFCRMDPPHQAVVEMRTARTRTFGFFSRPNTYVAISFDTVDGLKLPNRRADRTKYRAHAAKVDAFLKLVDPTEIDRTTSIENLITDDTA